MHTFCYYCAEQYEDDDDLRRRCGGIHLRAKNKKKEIPDSTPSEKGLLPSSFFVLLCFAVLCCVTFRFDSLRCVALRCVALRCNALHCFANMIVFQPQHGPARLIRN